MPKMKDVASAEVEPSVKKRNAKRTYGEWIGVYFLPGVFPADVPYAISRRMKIIRFDATSSP